MNSPLNRNLSVYLDLLRFLAATIVLLHHAHNFIFPYVQSEFVFGQGREAVAVFFVLSGFVIQFVVAEKERDWRSYVVARISRIYPVAVLAVGVTCVADIVGQLLNHQYYVDINEKYRFIIPVSIKSAVSYLTFTNQLWFRNSIFGTDGPYWSLGFEVWYYVLFGCLVFLPKNRKIVAGILWAVVCGPNIALYLPLWLLGTLVYRAISMRIFSRFGRLTSAALFVGSLIFYALVWRYLQTTAGVMSVGFSFLHAEQSFVNFRYFMLIGIAVAANIIAFNSLVGPSRFWGASAERFIRWAAGGSFTLYLLHQPLLVLAVAILPQAATAPLQGTAVCLLVMAGSFALAEVAERRKKWVAHAIRGLLAPYSTRAVGT